MRIGGRTGKMASGVAGIVLLTALAGCGSHGSSAPTTTASTTTTTVAAPTTTTTPPTTKAPATTRPPRTTTTTLAVPSSPQSSPDAAATAFVTAWKAGNKSAAAGVATKTAIAALFATPYKGQTVIDRGCSDQFLPRVCSWGDYGGGSGPLYEISVSGGGSKWYVSGAVVEG